MTYVLLFGGIVLVVLPLIGWASANTRGEKHAYAAVFAVALVLFICSASLWSPS